MISTIQAKKILFSVPLLVLVIKTGHASDVIMKMTTTDGTSQVDFKNSADAEVASIDSTGRLEVSSHVRTGGYISIPEVSDPGVASAGRARLFAKEVNGSTYLAYIDSAGDTRIIRPRTNITVSDVETAAANMGTTYRDVHWTLSAAALSRTVVDFGGYTEARIVFPVDNNEADTIQCRIYNETDAAEIVSAISDGTANPQLVVGSWTAINLVGDKIIQAQCREGTGATADPDIGAISIQIR